MKEMIPVFTRIVTRYGAGALIAYGIVSQETVDGLMADPDIMMLMGLLLGAITEGWYAFAKKSGGAT